MVNSLRQVFQGKWLFGIAIFFFIVSSAYVSGKEASAASAYNLTVKIKGENIEDTNNVEVKVTGSDNYEKTLSTNNTGLVRFKVLNNGNYTITPTKEGYRFDPSSKEVTLGKKRTVKVSFALAVNSVTEVAIVVSNPKNGTHFTVGQSSPIISISLPDKYSRKDYSELRLVVYGPQETTKTKTAVKLLNASIDRSLTIHHYIDLTTDENVQIDDNVLTYELQPITDEESGTYTGSVWAVLKDDATVQSMPLVDFQIGTATVEAQIVEKEKCGTCHLGADSGKFYIHHIDPYSGDPISISAGNWALDSWPVRTCKSCHNNDGYSAYTDPSDSTKKVVDQIVKRVHGVHMGVELKNPLNTDATTGIFKDYTDVVFPYGVRGEKNGSTWTEISGVKNCTACHADDRWKTNPSRLACGSCHDNIWFGDASFLPEGGELHPSDPQNNDSLCSSCHPSSGESDADIFPVAAVHKVGEQSLNSIDISMTTPVNGEYYTYSDDTSGVVVTVTIKDDNGTAIDHTKVDDTGSNFTAANLFVYGPRDGSKPVLTNILTKMTKLRASVTNITAGPWAGLNGETLKLAVDGSTAFDVTITGSEPATQSEVISSLNTAFNNNSANAKASASGTTTVKIESLTQGGENSKIAIYNGSVTTSMRWKPTGVTVDPYVLAGRASYPNNDLRNLTKVDSKVDYIDPDVTRNTENITYKLQGKFADLSSGTYCVLAYCVPARDTTTNASKVTDFKKNSGLGFITFQVGTATVEKKIATNCTDCHGDSVMHLYENNIHPAQFDPDYCKACHDYGHYNTGNAFVNQGGNSTNGWSGYGAVPIARRVHGVHRGKYLEYSEEIYANADYFKDVIFPQDIRNCTKCHSSETTGNRKTEPSRLACFACHDEDTAKSHGKLMTSDPTSDDPYSGDEVETCTVCHGSTSEFAVEKMHNISDPYKPPYKRDPGEY